MTTLSFAHLPHPIHQQILLALIPKRIPILRFGPLFSTPSGSRPHHLHLECLLPSVLGFPGKPSCPCLYIGKKELLKEAKQVFSVLPPSPHSFSPLSSSSSFLSLTLLQPRGLYVCCSPLRGCSSPPILPPVSTFFSIRSQVKFSQRGPPNLSRHSLSPSSFKIIFVTQFFKHHLLLRHFLYIVGIRRACTQGGPLEKSSVNICRDERMEVEVGGYYKKKKKKERKKEKGWRILSPLE